LHANLTPQERFERLCWFLEAQFGAENFTPISEPKLPPLPPGAAAGVKKAAGEDADTPSDAPMDVSDDEGDESKALAARRAAELDRLHRLGIPVPGLLIKVDKMEARVWLENLEIECAQKVFADRVRAVVERAVEVTAPLWG